MPKRASLQEIRCQSPSLKPCVRPPSLVVLSTSQRGALFWGQAARAGSIALQLPCSPGCKKARSFLEARACGEQAGAHAVLIKPGSVGVSSKCGLSVVGSNPRNAGAAFLRRKCKQRNKLCIVLSAAPA